MRGARLKSQLLSGQVQLLFDTYSMRITHRKLRQLVSEEVRSLREAPGRAAVPDQGEFYSSYDDETGMYCIFHTDVDDHAFGAFHDEREAETAARRMNAVRRGS